MSTLKEVDRKKLFHMEKVGLVKSGIVILTMKPQEGIAVIMAFPHENRGGTVLKNTKQVPQILYIRMFRPHTFITTLRAFLSFFAFLRLLHLWSLKFEALSSFSFLFPSHCVVALLALSQGKILFLIRILYILLLVFDPYATRFYFNDLDTLYVCL